MELFTEISPCRNTTFAGCANVDFSVSVPVVHTPPNARSAVDPALKRAPAVESVPALCTVYVPASNTALSDAPGTPALQFSGSPNSPLEALTQTESAAAAKRADDAEGRLAKIRSTFNS